MLDPYSRQCNGISFWYRTTPPNNALGGPWYDRKYDEGHRLHPNLSKSSRSSIPMDVALGRSNGTRSQISKSLTANTLKWGWKFQPLNFSQTDAWTSSPSRDLFDLGYTTNHHLFNTWINNFYKSIFFVPRSKKHSAAPVTHIWNFIATRKILR